MNNSIQKWLELIESDEQLYKDLVEKKSKYEATEAGLHKFLRKDFIPLAQSYGFEFSEEDLLEFQKQKMQKLDDDVLENIAGGKKNNMIGWGLLSILLLSSLPIGCMLVDRNEKPVDSLVNMSTDKKIKDNENLRNSTTTVNSDQFDNEDDDNNTTIFSKINKNGRDKRKKRNPSIYHETRSDIGKGGPLFRSSNNENLSKLMNVLENNKLKEKLKGSEGMLTEKKNVADRFAQQSTNERQEDQQRQNQSENKIGHNEREFDRLKRDLNNANEELSGSQETVKQSREGTQTDSLNVAKDEIDRLQVEVSEVKAELTRAQQTEKQANDESQRVGSEIAEERAKLVNLQSEIERQKEEINKVQAELAKAQQTERQANDERDQAREEERKSQLELSVVQDRSANQERENTNLKNQLKTLEGQLAEVRRQSEVLRGNLEREKSEKDEKSAELQKQLIEAKRKTDELQEQLTQGKKAFSTVKAELTRAQQALEQANNEKQGVDGEIAEERAKLINLQSEIDRLQGEVSEVKAELTRAQQTERQANDERDQAREEERKSQLELSGVLARSADQERENTSLKNQLKTLEDQLAEVRRQSEVLRGNLEREKDEKSAELQKQLIEAKRKTDELQEQLTQGKKAFSTVKAELTRVQQALGQANNESQRVGGEIAEERAKLVNLQSEFERLNEEFNKVKVELAKEQQAGRQTINERKIAEQERDQTREKERKSQLELSAVQDRSANQERENTNLKNQLKTLEGQLAEVRRQSEVLRGNLEREKSEKDENSAELQKQLIEAKRKTDELKEQLTQETEKFSTVQVELTKAQQALEQANNEKQRIGGEIAEERSELVNLQSGIDRLQGEVSEVKAELTRAQQTERQANDKRGMAEQERDQARKERKLQLELSDVRAKSAYKGIGNTDLANQQQALIDKPAEKQSESLSGNLKSEKRETQSKLDETTELQEQLTQDSITEAELDEAQQAKEEKFDSDGEKNQTEGTKTEERDDNLQEQLQEVQTVSAQGQLGEPPQEQSTEHSQEQKNGDVEPLQEVKKEPKDDGQGSMTEVYSKTEGTLESKAKEMPVQDSDQLQSLSSSPKTLAQLIKEAAKGIVQLGDKEESQRFEGESEEGNVISAARTCIQFNDLSGLEEYSATCVRQALIMYVRGTLNDATESSDRIETVEKTLGKILGKILCFHEDEINAISSGPENKEDAVRKRSIDPNYAFEEWFVQLVKEYNNKDKSSQDFVSRILRNRVICGGEVNQLEICKELKSKLFEEKDKIFGTEVDDSAKNEAPIEKENLKLPPDQVVECTTKNLPNDVRKFCFMNSVLQQLYRIDGLRKYNYQMLLNLREINGRDLNNEQKSEMEVRRELEKIFKYMDAKDTEVVELEASVEGDYKGIHEGFIAFGKSHDTLCFVDEIQNGLNDFQEAINFTMFMKKFFPDYIFGADENAGIVDLNPKKDIMVIMNSVQALEMSKYEKELTGFVLHTGSVHSGHYISYVKENGVWFIIDDIHGITKVDQHEVTAVIKDAKDLMKRENEITQKNKKIEEEMEKFAQKLTNRSDIDFEKALDDLNAQEAQYSAEKQKLVKAKEDLYKEYHQNPRITLCRYTKLS